MVLYAQVDLIKQTVEEVFAAVVNHYVVHDSLMFTVPAKSLHTGV